MVKSVPHGRAPNLAPTPGPSGSHGGSGSDRAPACRSHCRHCIALPASRTRSVCAQRQPSLAHTPNATQADLLSKTAVGCSAGAPPPMDPTAFEGLERFALDPSSVTKLKRRSGEAQPAPAWQTARDAAVAAITSCRPLRLLPPEVVAFLVVLDAVQVLGPLRVRERGDVPSRPLNACFSLKCAVSGAPPHNVTRLPLARQPAGLVCIPCVRICGGAVAGGRVGPGGLHRRCFLGGCRRRPSCAHRAPVRQRQLA